MRYSNLTRRLERISPSKRPLEFIVLDEGDPLPELDPNKEYYIAQVVYVD